MNDALVREKLVIERQIHEANASLDLYDGKASRMEEQVLRCFQVPDFAF